MKLDPLMMMEIAGYVPFQCTSDQASDKSVAGSGEGDSMSSKEVISKFILFTDRSLQASEQGTKTEGVTKKEEKRRIEAKESDTSTTRPRYETSFRRYKNKTV